MNRREFLERSAAAVSIAALSPAALVARAGMFISLNGAVAPRIGPWPEFARLAARLGYGGIDWSFAPVKAAGLEATKALLAELKLKPTIVNLPVQGPFAGDDEAFKQKLPPLADDSALSEALGCRKMMLVLSASASMPKDEYRKIVRDRLAAISEVLQKSNIRLGLEFLGPLYMRMGGAPRVPFIWTLPETVQLAKDCGPNIGAVLDVWHWHHSGGTIADILAAGKDRIIHVHLSDAKPMAPEEVRDNMRVMPGEGSIDLIAFLQALRKIGYDDGISPEPLGRIPAEMTAEDAAKLGFETTLRVMKQAGVA
jgi:sugar phosphate isomerase/epimerase